MTEERKKEILKAIYDFDGITPDEMRELGEPDCYNVYAIANNQMYEAMQVCRERGIEI